MSKQNRGAIAHDVTYIINQASALPHEEFELLYGIEFLAHGKILDSTYNQEFESIGEWAAFNVTEDMTEYSEHIGGYYYDEEGHY